MDYKDFCLTCLVTLAAINTVLKCVLFEDAEQRQRSKGQCVSPTPISQAG